MGSTGSRWTTGPLTSPHVSGKNPGQLALRAQGHIFRGEFDEVTAVKAGPPAREEAEEGVQTQRSIPDKALSAADFPSLFATGCVDDSGALPTADVAQTSTHGQATAADQHWQLSPGVQPRDAVGTLIELAGSNASSSSLELSQLATAVADKMCWRVLGCSSADKATVGIGRGCTPLPPQLANGSYQCGDNHNCGCNGGFAFHNDGTIRSLMDGHCLELLGGADEHGMSSNSGDVATGTCSGKSTQQFTATAVHSAMGSAVTTAFTISQLDGSGKKQCITSTPGPPPPPLPGPPCSSFKTQAACTTVKGEHCVWQNGACRQPPKPPPPPPPPPPQPKQPVVPEKDWDQHFVIEDNYIHDMPVEYHSAIGVFAGYIANSSISHNTMERLSYDGIQFGVSATHSCPTSTCPTSSVLAGSTYCDLLLTEHWIGHSGDGDRTRSQAVLESPTTQLTVSCRIRRMVATSTRRAHSTTPRFRGITARTTATGTIGVTAIPIPLRCRGLLCYCPVL